MTQAGTVLESSADDSRRKSDEALMQEYANGDPSAFEQLYARYRTPLFNYLLHHVGARAAAEDTFQDVFIRIIRARETYRPDGSFQAYVFKIARNAVIDGRRRGAARRPRGRNESAMAVPVDELGSDEAPRATVATDPVIAAQRAALLDNIRAALAKLPETQREVFLLRERAGLEFHAIAEATGEKLATVKSRMRYALDGLRRHLSMELTHIPEQTHD